MLLEPAASLDRLVDVLSGQSAGPLDAFGDRLLQCRHDGRHVLPVKRTRAVAEADQADGVEGQLGHVGADVHRVAGIEAGPLHHQLIGDIGHLLGVAPDRLWGECRQQDVVCLFPGGLLGPGGEDGVADDLPHHDLFGWDVLLEPCFVEAFRHHLAAGDHDDVLAGCHQGVDRPELPGQVHQAARGMVGVDVQGVTQNRNAVGRSGDVLVGLCGWHRDVATFLVCVC